MTTIYGLFDAEGAPQGFWPDDIYLPADDGTRNAAIPADAIVVTEEQWKTLVTYPNARLIDGAIVMVEVVPDPPNPTVHDTEAVRANRRLDEGATAAYVVVQDARAGFLSMPPHGTPPSVEELQAQVDYLAAQTKILADSFAALVDAQAPPAQMPA